jgi:hypothetical protein
MNNYSVYGLYDTRENFFISYYIRYYGITCNPVSTRFKGHLSAPAPMIKNWIEEIGEENVGYIILKTGISKEEAYKHESYYILKERMYSNRLLNHQNGGNSFTTTFAMVHLYNQPFFDISPEKLYNHFKPYIRLSYYKFINHYKNDAIQNLIMKYFIQERALALRKPKNGLINWNLNEILNDD